MGIRVQTLETPPCTIKKCPPGFPNIAWPHPVGAIPVWSLRSLEGEAALRRNRNPADCKEEKECAEEACSGRDVD